MSAYEITKEQVNGEFICEGYKAIQWDSSTMGDSEFYYGTEGENFIGKIFTVDGIIRPCENGLHFCKNPKNIFNYYNLDNTNRYFKVKAYGIALDADEGQKTVARTIEFIEEYNFIEFLDLIEKTDYNIYKNLYRNTLANNGCSMGMACSMGNFLSYGCNDSNHNVTSDGCDHSDNNSHSNGIYASHNNSYSNGIFASDGDLDSKGINFCFGLRNCNGAYNSVFCYGEDGIANYLFNKKSTKERCREVILKLKDFGWRPKWNNISELIDNQEFYYKVNYHKIKDFTLAKAWAEMPEEMFEYIKSLPEYDEEIFNAITFKIDAI